MRQFNHEPLTFGDLPPALVGNTGAGGLSSGCLSCGVMRLWDLNISCYNHKAGWWDDLGPFQPWILSTPETHS
jgi:hypothetical protein